MEQIREVPGNPDLEADLLACVLVDGKCARRLGERFTLDLFQRHAHRLVAEGVLDAVARHVAPTTELVIDYLADRGKVEEAGGWSTIAGLTSRVFHSGNAEELVRRLGDYATRRRGIEACGRMAAAFFGGEQLTDTLAEWRAMTSYIEGSRGEDGALTVRQLRDEWAARIARSRETGITRGIRTGFTELDTLTGGMKPGELWYVCARPGVGKSAWALDVAQFVASQAQARGEGETVDYVTLEMRAQEQFDRLLASRAGIDGRTLRAEFRGEDGAFDEVSYSRAERFSHRLVNSCGDALRLPDKPVTLKSLRTQLARGVEERKLILAVVDYLALIRGADDGRKAKDEYHRVSEIARGLKDLAQECGIPILAAVQLNRALEARAEKRPMLADLRDSGELEQAANGVLGLYRPVMYAQEKADQTVLIDGEPVDTFNRYAEVLILKARSGVVGMVPLQFEAQYTRFSNWPREWAQEARRLRDDRDGGKGHVA